MVDDLVRTEAVWDAEYTLSQTRAVIQSYCTGGGLALACFQVSVRASPTRHPVDLPGSLTTLDLRVSGKREMVEEVMAIGKLFESAIHAQCVLYIMQE